MSLSTCYLEYGRHVARLRRRRRRAYAPTSNTASHDNHEKINSWVSFCFPYEYGAPLGRTAGAPLYRCNRANRLTDELFCTKYRSPDICKSADSGSSKHYNSCQFEVKSMQPGLQIYYMLQSIITCFPIIYGLSVSINWKKLFYSLFSVTSSRNMHATCKHARKDLYTLCGKQGSWYKTYFISLKPVLACQTLTLATLWQMGHNAQAGFFSGQELLWFWTLLPG